MSKPTYPPAWLADLFGLTVTKFSAQKAHKVLGWQPLISLEEGQERTTRWLQEIGLGE